jgi:uncharacterized protein YceH (UPF0502 family)
LKVELTPLEARALGSLIEKELTTPDQYPLSLNALLLACNQKTNRDPVMELDEGTVQRTLDGLARKHLVFERGGFGSRVPKYQQRLCGTEFAELKLTPQERGILCVLLLRGPQTPGELRTRTNRLCEFTGVEEVEAVLRGLIERDAGALVAPLPRSPGERELRYAQLLTGEPAAAQRPAADAAPIAAAREPAAPAPVSAGLPANTAPGASGDERIGHIERELQALRAELEALKRRLGEP